MSSDMRLVLEVIDRATGSLSSMRFGLEDVQVAASGAEGKLVALQDNLNKTGADAEKSGGRITQSWTDVVTGVNQGVEVFQKVLHAATEVWELLEAGDALQQAEKRFAALSISVGSSAEEMMRLMQEATQGALTQAQIAGSIGPLIEMGIVKSKEQAYELADLIIRLKKPTQDATEAFEEFGLMIANTSIKRLDTFGISADHVRARMEELQDGAQHLTRDQAFLTATIEEGNISLLRTGRATGEVATQYDKMNAKLGEMKDAFLLSVAEGIEPMITELVVFVTEQSPEIIATIKNVSVIVAAVGKAALDTAMAFGQATQAMMSYWGEVEGRMNPEDMSFWEVGDEFFALTVQLETLRAELMKNPGSIDLVTEAWDRTQGAMWPTRDGIRAMRELLEELRGEQDRVVESSTQEALIHQSLSEQLHEQWLMQKAVILADDELVGATEKLNAGMEHQAGVLAANVSAWSTNKEAMAAYEIEGHKIETRMAGISAGWALLDQAQQTTAANMSGYLLTAMKDAGAGADGLSGAVMASLEKFGAGPGLILGFTQALNEDFDPAVIEAALKSAYLQQAIDLVVQRLMAGDLSAQQAAAAVKIFEGNANTLNLVPASVVIDGIILKLDEAGRPRTISFTIIPPDWRQLPTPDDFPTPNYSPPLPGGGSQTPLPGGGSSGGGSGGGGSHPYEYAIGGWTGATGGIVHPYELVVPGNVVSSGGMLSFAQANVPGGYRDASLHSESGGLTVSVYVDATNSTIAEAALRDAVDAGVEAALRRVAGRGEMLRRAG